MHFADVSGLTDKGSDFALQNLASNPVDLGVDARGLGSSILGDGDNGAGLNLLTGINVFNRSSLSARCKSCRRKQCNNH